MSTHPTQREGDSGEWVTYAQRLLTNAGYPPQGGQENDHFGPMTKEAVRDFQGAHHLTVDGVIGPRTWDALEHAGSGGSHGGGGHDSKYGSYQVVEGDHPTLHHGHGGTWVEYAQGLLTSGGHPPSDHLTDGRFGPNTEEAVKQFQQAHHLTADGVIGQRTWTALEGGGGGGGGGAGSAHLEFGTHPHIAEGGCIWTVRNAGSATVPTGTAAGEYEMYRDDNNAKTPGDTMTTMVDLAPGDVSGSFLVNLIAYTETDGTYQVAVQVGNNVDFVLYEVKDGHIKEL